MRLVGAGAGRNEKGLYRSGASFSSLFKINSATSSADISFTSTYPKFERMATTVLSFTTLLGGASYDNAGLGANFGAIKIPIPVKLRANTTEPPTLSPGIAQAGLHPLLNQNTLKFCHGADDPKHQPTGRRTQVQVVAQTDEGNTKDL
jgi:hypothetical protein